MNCSLGLPAKISNRQSAIRWRRGQDSNLHSLSAGGFQDRCTTIMRPLRIRYTMFACDQQYSAARHRRKIPAKVSGLKSQGPNGLTAKTPRRRDANKPIQQLM